jgi:hypothetical protein
MDLTDLIREVHAATPDGWDVKDARTQTIYRIAPIKEITAETREALDAQIPDGWMLLSILGD